MRAWRPVRRRERRKYRKMHFQEFWDSCAQNKTSEISITTLPGILRLLCADQASEISNNALSGFLELLCADQNIGNIENCTFRISGTPVHRTTRPKYQEMYLQKFWDSCAQNKTSHISKHALCLVGSMSLELCLNSAWSQDMKYRASLPPICCDSLPRELCLNSVWSESMKYRASLSPFFLTVCLVVSVSRELYLNSLCGPKV